MERKSFPRAMLEIADLALAVLAGLAVLLSIYTVLVLNWARGQGVYATPQEGVRAKAERYYCGVEKVEIEQAATNSFDGSNPHIWYVIYRVYADHRTPCDAAHPGAALTHQGYENAGGFWLNVKQGWVFMPEGKFPMVIGFWMKVLGLAGPGDPYHIPLGG